MALQKTTGTIFESYSIFDRRRRTSIPADHIDPFLLDVVAANDHLFPTHLRANMTIARKHLLSAWQIAVSDAIDTMMRIYVRESLCWGVGWYLGPNCAYYRLDNDHIFYLNPLLDSGADAYTISDRLDHFRIIGTALHEVAHVISPTHDDAFSTALTEMFRETDQQQVQQRIAARLCSTPSILRNVSIGARHRLILSILQAAGRPMDRNELLAELDRINAFPATGQHWGHARLTELAKAEPPLVRSIAKARSSLSNKNVFIYEITVDGVALLQAGGGAPPPVD